MEFVQISYLFRIPYVVFLIGDIHFTTVIHPYGPNKRINQASMLMVVNCHVKHYSIIPQSG